MQQVLSNTSKVMVDAQGNGNLLLLPLDKLMQQSSTGPAPVKVDPQSAAGLSAKRSGCTFIMAA